MSSQKVTYIGSIAVETRSVLIASQVLSMVRDSRQVRGSVRILGKQVRWSTIQQFERHGGFEK